MSTSKHMPPEVVEKHCGRINTDILSGWEKGIGPMYIASAEFSAELERFAKRQPNMIGHEAADFVRDAVQASCLKKQEICKKYGISNFIV